MVILRWFCSKTVREATTMRRHVERLLRAQRDLLATPAIETVAAACHEVRKAVRSGGDGVALKKQMENLEKAANKWLKPYPHAAWRENVEVLLVALAVAMAIRTFFLQPFKIPTGSMQPTLFGVTSLNLAEHSEVKPTAGLERVKDWFQGVSYVRLVAKASGPIQRVENPVRLLIFNIKQTIWIGGVPHTLWFPPDCGQQDIASRGGVRPGDEFERGEQVFHVRVQSGDHLFVDRLRYNFRNPQRGDIIVFETAGTRIAAQDQFYIKRLVGLGGEMVGVSSDYDVEEVPQPGGGTATVPVGRVIISGEPLVSDDGPFANIYSFPDAMRGSRTFRYRENHYCGHAQVGDLSGGRSVSIPAGHLFAMGDNTHNSADSRVWGTVPAQNVIGMSFFVYWPISERFGWGQH